MSEPAWTPGPWTLSAQDLWGGRYWSVLLAGDLDPIDLHEDENGEVNARLIAAAPTMAKYIETRAIGGDSDAIAIWEQINGDAKGNQAMERGDG